MYFFHTNKNFFEREKATCQKDVCCIVQVEHRKSLAKKQESKQG